MLAHHTTDVWLSPSLLFPWVKATLSALLVPSDYYLEEMQCFILPRNLVKKWLGNHIQKGPLKSHLDSADYLLYDNGLFRWERTIASFLIWNH